MPAFGSTECVLSVHSLDTAQAYSNTLSLTDYRSLVGWLVLQLPVATVLPDSLWQLPVTNIRALSL